MNRFRFRLERVARWRRIVKEQRERDHESALRDLSSVRGAMDRHREDLARCLEAQARMVAEGPIESGRLTAAEIDRALLARRGSTLGGELSAAIARSEETAAALVEADREVKVLDRLRASRFGAWRHALETEMQKQSDEAYLARLLRERTHGEATAE